MNSSHSALDQAIREAEGMDQHLVARRLIVPMEAAAGMAGLADAAVIRDEGKVRDLVAYGQLRRL